jgi:hypothetical protein
MTKQVRWKCANCNHGLLAPTKPRKNDVRRYCLPCSGKTGKLVERVSPTLEKQRTTKKAAVKKKTVAKRATVAKRTAPAKAQQRVDAQRAKIIHAEAEKIWKLMQPYHKGKPLPKINIARGRNHGSQYGYAQSSWNNIQVNVDRDQTVSRSKRVWEVLAHELCHCAVPPTRRLDKTRDVHSREFYGCLKDVWQRRWKCEISFAKVSTWGYSVDYIIQGQAEHLIDWVLPTVEVASIQ